MGLSIFVSVVILNAAVQWTAFQQLRSRALVQIDDDLVMDFIAITTRHLLYESAVLLAGVLVIVGLLRAIGMAPEPRRLFATLLLSTAPAAAYALGVSVALVTGWELNAWVLSTPGATHEQIAATIHDAIPAIVDPRSRGRYAVIAASTLLSIALQMRCCGAGVYRSSLAAAGYGALLSVTHVV